MIAVLLLLVCIELFLTRSEGLEKVRLFGIFMCLADSYHCNDVWNIPNISTVSGSFLTP